MSVVMKASDFIKKLKDIAENYKTLYVMGCFGAPMSSKNKKRYCSNHSYNMKATRTKMIQAASSDTFGFDCVCLIKAVLWGWNGNTGKTYGGATYKANGVPDVSADGMIKLCSGVSTDFSKIEPGEAVWTNGHIGVYIGNGLAIECTPAWKNKVQITACNCTKSGYNTRNWKKHGKLPYIAYDVTEPETPVKEENSTEKIIWDFLLSKIGNAYGVAGLIGNLKSESALKPNNMQNSYERKLGFTDETYTKAVDNGSYIKFATDKVGYGLAQWTSSGRKKKLLDYAKNKGASIGDLNMQLEYLFSELSGSYKKVLTVLKSATSVQEASDAVLTKFECPANQSDGVKKARAKNGTEFYKKYVSSSNNTTTPTKSTKPSSVKVDSAQKKDTSIAGSYTVTASSLNIRAGADAKKTSLGILKKGEVVENYGFYSVASNGVKWFYVKTKSGIVGFCSSKYLKKC